MASVTGDKAVAAKLQQLAREVPNLVERSMYEEMSIESVESQHKTPVDTGALRNSHRVTTERKLGEISATITVGGPSAPYAPDVHENLEAFHVTGEAKFLESTIDEARPHLAGRVARRVDLARAAR